MAVQFEWPLTGEWITDTVDSCRPLRMGLNSAQAHPALHDRLLGRRPRWGVARFAQSQGLQELHQLVVHAIGTTLKYRLEGRVGPPLGWEWALFWPGWACLAALGRWIAVFRAVRSRAP